MNPKIATPRELEDLAEPSMMRFPSQADVAAEAGVSFDAVNSFDCKRRPDHSFKIRDAQKKLGYVSSPLRSVMLTHKFPAFAIAGNGAKYLPALSKTLDLPLIVPCQEYNDPLYLIQKYFVTNVLVFDFNFTIEDLEEWVVIDRKIILIDCPEQCIFNSINGFSIEETVKLINIMIRNYRTLPLQFKGLVG